MVDYSLKTKETMINAKQVFFKAQSFIAFSGIIYKTLLVVCICKWYHSRSWDLIQLKGKAVFRGGTLVWKQEQKEKCKMVCDSSVTQPEEGIRSSINCF